MTPQSEGLVMINRFSTFELLCMIVGGTTLILLGVSLILFIVNALYNGTVRAKRLKAEVHVLTEALDASHKCSRALEERNDDLRVRLREAQLYPPTKITEAPSVPDAVSASRLPDSHGPFT
jgi:hypothetical protein